jgi:hypothetical protein
MMTRMRPWLSLITFLAVTAPRESQALRIPAFARKYKVSCAQCHAPVPRLNDFGDTFAANGFRFAPGEEPRDTIATGDSLLTLNAALPLAVRFDAYLRGLTNRKGDENAADIQTPWVMKLLSGGPVAKNVSYYLYFLLSERGEVAGLEDAWVQFTDLFGSNASVTVGQFQVSDPLFKREIRLPYEDYQVYRLRVGQATADLTYDRGAMFLYSPWEGGDFTAELVTGAGLQKATVNRQYDRDTPKNVALRFSQEFGPLRLGVFNYFGTEKSNGVSNDIRVFGPDATIPLGRLGQLNAQYLRRTDNDPFFGACSVARPCPGGATRAVSTTVDGVLAEALLWPRGQTDRLFFTATYNRLTADQPVIALRLGQDGDTPSGYLTEYTTVAGAVHYVYRRNVRLMSEVDWDFRREQARFVLGTVLAF